MVTLRLMEALCASGTDHDLGLAIIVHDVVGTVAGDVGTEAARNGVDVAIVARSHDVVAWSAIEGVTSIARPQDVLAAIAEQRVVAGVAVQRVGADVPRM